MGVDLNLRAKVERQVNEMYSEWEVNKQGYMRKFLFLENSLVTISY